MKLFKLLFITILALTAAFILGQKVSADISSYTASGFSQFCSQNSSCSKNETPGNRSGIVSCPSDDQIIDKVYVHAGNGQTVFELPDSGYSAVYGSNNREVTVSVLGTGPNHPDLSWIAVVCSVNTTPTPTPTPEPEYCDDEEAINYEEEGECEYEEEETPTPTETETPTPTPTCEEDQTCIILDCPGEGECSVDTDPTPTTTPTPTPTATITPTPTSAQTNNGGGSNNNSSNNSSTVQTASATSSQSVLGTSTMAKTGTFSQTFANALMSLGAVFMLLPTALYGWTKKKIFFR